MQKLLIISSTKNSNFDLSKSIKSYIKETKDLNCEIVSLEDFDLPLYTPTLEEKFKKNQSFPQNIEKSKNLICSSNAIIWCSPEYNGGISPIVTNAIAWISRATENWKDGFKDKPSLICTSSGGNGKNFIEGFRIQLNYLGSRVFGKSLIQTKSKEIQKEEFCSVLDSFCKNI